MPMRLKLFLGLLMFLLGATTVNAQTKLKMSIASFEADPFDTTPQNSLYEKIDGSGARYAIIKVSSNNPDDQLKEYHFNFGNLKSIVEEHDDELWVYVQKNAKMVTISRNGYKTINKYDLETTIEAGKTYVMMLNVAKPIVYTQMVQFVIKPENSGAIVTVKSSKENAQEEMFGTTDETGTVAKALELGTYTYKIIANNYHTSEGRITLNDRKNTYKEEVTLRANFSEITLTVDADADIYVNSEKKAVRTWTGVLRAGDYQVECRQEGHRTSTQLVSVTAGDNRTYQLTPPTPITGTLSLTSKPLGANIAIDGREYGQTPQNITDLLIGNHTITLSMEKYQAASQTFVVAENQTTELNVVLSKIPRSEKEKAGDEAKKKEEEKARLKQEQEQKRWLAESSKPVKTDTGSPSVGGYIQPAAQVGTMMGFGGNVGLYISDFNVEGYITMGMSKVAVPMYNTSTLATSEANISGMMFGVKLGYGIKAGSSVRVTPQVGVGVLNVSGDNVGSSAVCATAGARIEIAFGKNFGISLTPEGQFAVSKKEVFKAMEEASGKIKGWGTGANLRVGVFVKF